MTPEPVAVTLEPDEALVLYELVARYTNADRLEVIDQAEQRALWNLCASLERALVEPLDPNYQQLVAAARERLRDSED